MPLSFEKSKWYIVAMLGVWMAGAAFTPIDPQIPANRVTALLNRVVGGGKGGVVVTSRKQEYRISQLTMPDTHVIALDEMTMVSLLTQQPSEPSGIRSRTSESGSGSDSELRSESEPEPETESDTESASESSANWEKEQYPGSDSAYCIFTSGSTGEPKGVVVEHYALATSVLAHGTAMGISSDSRTLHFTSCSFDASLTEIVATLVHGGCEYIYSQRKSTIKLEHSNSRNTLQ